ncbi:MAG: oligosaccharide flippase family protein [archaeon]|nr:oligosaccharide flippase family protein [archaeon]
MKQKLKSLFSEQELILNSSMVFGASFAGAIFMFVSNLVLSRAFGPEVFGNYKTIIGLFLFIPALIDFGAAPTLTKYIAEFSAKKESGKINKLIRFFLKIKGFSIVSVVLIIYVFRDAFAHMFLKDEALSILILPGLTLSLFILFEITKPIIAGFQNFRLFSFSNFLTTATIGIATVALGYYYGIYYAILGWPVGYLIGNLPNIWHLARKNFLHKKNTQLNMAPIFKTYALPMWGVYLLNMSSLLIIPILSLFFAQRLIGYYGFAWTFYSGVILIPIALSQVLFPKVCELHGSKKFNQAKAELKKVFVLYTPIAIAGIAGTLMFSEYVIALIAPAYLPGLFIFKALVCFCFPSGYLQIYRTYLSAKTDVKGVIIWTGILNLALLIVSLCTMRFYII